jgi:hypothetical protein
MDYFFTLVHFSSLRAFLALTPVQRWEAARGFNSIVTERWFIMAMVIAIVVLAVLLVIVSFNKVRQQRRADNRVFVEFAKERGLNVHERQTLLDVANKAGLKSSESIFTLASAFDQGVTKLQESLAGRQTDEESNELRTDLSHLREKLGFDKQAAVPAGASNLSKKLSSRQIPVGKKVHMTRRKTRGGGEVESTVVRNSDTELEVRLDKLVKITFGEFWCVRYYFGSSVWEFDTSVISYDGNILVLNHSDDVRFINRRRFFRVPVRKPAFIARFPFAKSSEPGWGPPEFVSAVVTELAGPGLRVEAPLQVKTGERVMVVFNLDEEQGADSATSEAGILRVVEDIGMVRHTNSMPDGMSIAVELTGLSDSDIDDLVQVTNAALVKVGAGVENTSASAKPEDNAQLVAAQGNGTAE